MPGCGCNRGNPKVETKSYQDLKNNLTSVKAKSVIEDKKVKTVAVPVTPAIKLSTATPIAKPTPVVTVAKPTPVVTVAKPTPVVTVAKPTPVVTVAKTFNVNPKKKNMTANSKSKQLDMYYSRFKKGEFDSLPKSDLRSWDRIHKLASKATTPELKGEFEKYIRYLAFNFPCPKCQPHIKERMLSNPIKNYYNTLDEKGRDIGVAKWSWEFHNSVNERNKKSTFPWEKFKEKYLK
jgi:hypothetical protein